MPYICTLQYLGHVVELGHQGDVLHGPGPLLVLSLKEQRRLASTTLYHIKNTATLSPLTFFLQKTVGSFEIGQVGRTNIEGGGDVTHPIP